MWFWHDTSHGHGDRPSVQLVKSLLTAPLASKGQLPEVIKELPFTRHLFKSDQVQFADARPTRRAVDSTY